MTLHTFSFAAIPAPTATATDSSATTASVVAAKNQSLIRTYSTTDSSTRSIGVAISTSSPALSNRLVAGASGVDEEQAQPDGQGRGADRHADDEQPADVILEACERVGLRWS